MTPMRTGSKKLMNVLTTPSKIANSLDWKKSTGGAIATLNIQADRIGVKISRHPESSVGSKSISDSYSFPVSPRGKFKITNATKQSLSDLVLQHKVCGFVVSWPLQEDTGSMGAACGRTLFAIEELLREPPSSEEGQRPVFTSSRPLCLWNDGSHENGSSFDAFGRSPLYARTSQKTEHFASKEQYRQDESIEEAKIWEEFVRSNWPEFDRQQQKTQQNNRSEEIVSDAMVWGNQTEPARKRLSAMAA